MLDDVDVAQEENEVRKELEAKHGEEAAESKQNTAVARQVKSVEEVRYSVEKLEEAVQEDQAEILKQLENVVVED